MKLGELMRAYRHDNDMTMQEFADRAGLSKGYVSMLERNKHPQSQRELVPSFETYEKVASAMGMTLDDVISALDGNEGVKLNSVEVDSFSSSLQLSSQEEHLVVTFRGLNDEGKEKAVERVEELLDVPRYQVKDPYRETADRVLGEFQARLSNKKSL